jgi:hypothetical protein
VIASEPSQYRVLTTRPRPSPHSAPASTASAVLGQSGGRSISTSISNPATSGGATGAGLGSGSRDVEPGVSGQDRGVTNAPTVSNSELEQSENEIPSNYTPARGRGDVVFRNDPNDGNYVLVVDARGSRWEQKQPPSSTTDGIARHSAATGGIPVAHEGQKQQGNYSSSSRKNDRYANAPEIAAVMGTGGVGGGEEWLVELRRSEDKRPQMHAQTLNDTPSVPSDEVPATAYSGGGPESMLNLPVFRQPYVDPKMHRNDLAGGAGTGSGGEDVFGGQRSGPRYCSRVKVHNVEAVPVEAPDNLLGGSGEGSGDGIAEASVKENGDGEGEDGRAPASSDMMRLLELLVTTQQQTLQVLLGD